MLGDLRHAFRQLCKSPAFTAVAVITLALGIGANTAIFGVVDRLMLNPLPYENTDGLVYVRLGSPRFAFGYPTPAYIARAWRDEAHSFDGVEAYSRRDLLAYDDRGARLVHGMSVTAGLPALLGVQPVLGRAFASNEAEPGARPVALVSYAMWQRDYGGGNIVGRAITLDGVSRTIVGVMPPGADAVSADAQTADVWVPLSLDAPDMGLPVNSIDVVARLRDGVAADQSARELDQIAKRAYDAATNRVIGADFVARLMTPAEKFVRPATRAALLVLLGAVGLVLLVACTNVANLLLARGASRQRDIALRAALGASGWRLVRQLMAECLVLALAAGAVGVAIGWLVLDALVRIRPGDLARLGGLRLEPFVLAFTFGLSLVTAVVFGLVPSLQLIRSRLSGALRHGGFGVVRGGAGMRLRALLVAAEMAVSVILLVSAGLLVRSVVNLQHVDAGFDPHNLFSVQLSLPRARYQAQQSQDGFVKELLERVRALPGVEAATQALAAPPSSIMVSGLEIRGQALADAESRSAYAYNFVRPGYFRTLGIPLLAGRTFSDAEIASGEAVVVNEAAVRRFWPAESALGHQLRIGPNKWATVVGVVGDVEMNGMDGVGQATHRPQFYRPYGPVGLPTFFGAPPRVLLIVRSAADPAPVIAAIRAAVNAFDAEVAVPSVTLAETALARSIDGPRFNMGLLTAFAVLALVLAAVGLAAVTSYAVAERTHEIGIRMALGAREGNVRRLVILQGMSAAVAGVLVGVIGALGATRLISSLLYGVAPSDPLTFAAVAVLLLAVALVASWLPTERATRVDPIVALRAE